MAKNSCLFSRKLTILFFQFTLLIYKLAYSDPIVLAEFACFCRNLLESNYKKEKNRNGHHRLLTSFVVELLGQDCSVCVLHRTCLRTYDTATEDKLLGFNFQKLCLHYTLTTSAKAYRWQELPLVSRLGKVNFRRVNEKQAQKWKKQLITSIDIFSN